MVTVRIHETGQELESTDGKVTYIKAAGDLADITTVNSSYSHSMKFPKTPKNTQILDGLGLVGSGSKKPYRKIYCDLLDNGYPIVIKGLLNISETSENYGLYVQEGFIDFLRDLQNDTIGGALDLTALDHDRTVNAVTQSLDLSLPYAYLISDVNGAYNANISDTTNLRVSHMAPFARVLFLWDAIFDHYGWTYSMPPATLSAITALWMSYPSEIVYGTDPEDTELVGEISATNTSGIPRSNIAYQILILPTQTLDPAFVSVVGGTFNTRFRIQQTGNYLLEYGSQGLGRLETQYGVVSFTGYVNQIYVNGSLVDTGTRNDSIDSKEVQLQLFDGDEVELVAYLDNTEIDTTVDVSSATLNIYHLDQGEVSFTQALIKYRISDFIKEIMVREALTSFVDSEAKNIDFVPLANRFDAEVVDWTKLYAKRVNETYLYRDYARDNFLRHRYDLDGADYADGSLVVDNENLAQGRDLYQSRSFAPEQELTAFQSGGTIYQVPRIKMFEVEVSEEDGQLIGTYKHLKDRFFFVRHQTSNRNIYIDNVLAEDIPLVSINGTIFRDIVTSKYADFFRMATDAKVHNIELTPGLSDIIHLDLKKIYYFGQEAAHYILNRLIYDTGEPSRGEFMKIEPRPKQAAFSNGFSNAFNI